ncbi:hypothetical protein A0H81_12664 [Grifola frondosa]|uniref:Uncharacterized protein n=1 Tax=Grifola frondosa TaxID=5627 RepID=A0A1C7LTI3_GRIFR|nr:hypothetical protein A0H81_12664 [Grifola frondosa]
MLIDNNIHQKIHERAPEDGALINNNVHQKNMQLDPASSLHTTCTRRLVSVRPKTDAHPHNVHQTIHERAPEDGALINNNVHQKIKDDFE